MNRKPAFNAAERLHIYEQALAYVEEGGTEHPRPICGAISSAIEKIIPIDHTWHYEIEWDFPELWSLRPEGIEPQHTGCIWWDFDEDGYKARIDALANSIVNVKKLVP